MAGKGFPAPMRQLLNPEGGVCRDLVRRVHHLRALEREVQRCLGSVPGGRRVHVAGLEHSRLRLVTDSPAWSARLRYHCADLLACLIRSGHAVAHIQIRVAPRRADAMPERERGTARRAHLSADSARLIRDYARTVRDPALRAALERLSGRRGGPAR